MNTMRTLVAICGCGLGAGCATLGNGKLDVPQPVIDAAKVDPRAAEAINVLQQFGLLSGTVAALDTGCDGCITNVSYTDLDGKPIDPPAPYRKVKTYSRAEVETVQP